MTTPLECGWFAHTVRRENSALSGSDLLHVAQSGFKSPDFLDVVGAHGGEQMGAKRLRRSCVSTRSKMRFVSRETRSQAAPFEPATNRCAYQQCRSAKL